MKLYKISQTANTEYDTYDSAVVAAESEELAKRINPGNHRRWSEELCGWVWVVRWKGEVGKIEVDKTESDDSWVNDLALVKVEYLGEAAEGIPAGVICASFNAG